jgi:hypothetical protein
MMKKRISYLFAAIVTCGISAASVEKSGAQSAKKTATVSPEGHQKIKAIILDETPENFTVDLEIPRNLGADENARTFAVFTGEEPTRCRDFQGLSLPYKRLGKYKRIFDLSSHPEVLRAIKNPGCVVIQNIPSPE